MPAMTTAQRQARRLALLNEAAIAAGWTGWRQYERSVANGAAAVTKKSTTTQLPAVSVAERAATAYELRPCNYRDTDGDQTPREFAARLAENAGMTATRGLVAELVKLIEREQDA